jgi:hypothetical protein
MAKKGDAKRRRERLSENRAAGPRAVSGIIDFQERERKQSIELEAREKDGEAYPRREVHLSLCKFLFTHLH